MKEDQITSEVEKFALNHSTAEDIHGYPHLKRVYNTCILIGKKLNANLLILKMVLKIKPVAIFIYANMHTKIIIATIKSIAVNSG